MKKGEMTVFLSIVFVLMISFISGIIQASSIQAGKNLARLETDRAVYSVFGEYQKELLEQYHIFGLEGSYGTGSYTEDNTSYGNYQSDNYEFIPNIRIRYELKTDSEIFVIEHKCAFINETKTRIIPIQENSRLTNS